MPSRPSRRIRGGSRTLILTCALTLLAPSAAAAADPVASSEIAGARYLSHRLGGSPSQYRLLASRPTVSVASGSIASARVAAGDWLWSAKYLDTRTGEVKLVYGEYAASGSAMSSISNIFGAAEFARREALALAGLPALQRKADPALQRHLLSLAAADAEVPVALWLHSDTAGVVAAVRARHADVRWVGDRPSTNDAQRLERILRELFEAKSGRYAEALTAAALTVRGLGGRPAYVSTSLPILFADMPRDRLAQLAERPEVDTLSLDAGGWSEQMRQAGPRVHAEWSTSGEDDASGVRVAVIEYYNVRARGDLAGQVVASRSTRGAPRYDPAFDHASWVAGAIAGLDRYDRGVAPGARIVSSSTGGGAEGFQRDADVMNATDWAVDPNGGRARLVNVSLAQDTRDGAILARKYFDALAYEHGILTIAAAGNYNRGYYGGYLIGSPGLGWNVLTVGGIDDRGTLAQGDDRIWYRPNANPPQGGSFVERTGTAYNRHGDFNKPDVSAPAVTVSTANGLRASGTSVATPIVSGICAQLLARRPELAAFPHATRALIMAGAVSHTRMANGTISRDHEGVGTVDAFWSKRSAVRGGGRFGGFDYGQLTSSAGLSRSFYAEKGQRIRIALTWESQTRGTGTSGTDVLTADLDLVVRLPNQTLRRSVTYDNSHEFVEFIAPSTGRITVNVSAARFDAAAEYWALAWSKS